MPRRFGHFQKAFADWLDVNQPRFALAVKLKMGKSGSVSVELSNQPACLRIHANRINLGVWVHWDAITWDALLDLDVLAVRTRQGYRCRLCEEAVQFWPDLELLWADHLFEPFLQWINASYAKAQAITLLGNAATCTTAQLYRYGQPQATNEVVAVIPLHPHQADLVATNIPESTM